MSRGEDIPQDVWDTAMSVATSVRPDMNGLAVVLGSHCFAALLTNIATAIMAARLSERERCANVAILHGSRCELREAVDAPLSKTRLEKLERVLHTCEDIAAAIRAGA